MTKQIISRQKSIIPACDVPFEAFPDILRATKDLEQVGAYKLPANAGRKGWERWVQVARSYTDKPLIYDHQKAGTDIPDTADFFMEELKASGIDAVILFPQAGPITADKWIEAANRKNLGVLVGGWMTHPQYLQSEGGYIADDRVLDIFFRAACSGVENFVVPGNKIPAIKKIREVLDERRVNYVLYSPGFVAQGGSISEAANAAGRSWHAIVGRGLYEKGKDDTGKPIYNSEKEMREAAEKLVKEL